MIWAKKYLNVLFLKTAVYLAFSLGALLTIMLKVETLNRQRKTMKSVIYWFEGSSRKHVRHKASLLFTGPRICRPQLSHQPDCMTLACCMKTKRRAMKPPGNRSQNTTYNFHVCGKKQYSIDVSQQLTLSLCFSIYWRSSIHRFCVSSVVKSQRRCTWCLSGWYHCSPHVPLCVWVPVCILCVLRFSVVFTCDSGLFQPPAGVWMDWQTEWYYVVRLQVTMRSVFVSWLQCAKEQVDSASQSPERYNKRTSYCPHNWPSHKTFLWYTNLEKDVAVLDKIVSHFSIP